MARRVVLSTTDARVVPIDMTLRQRVLSAVAHPNIAYLLLSLGTLGLTIELWSPGAMLPGVVGGVALLLAFFAFSVLPVNYAGLLLILFGLLLLVLEIKVTSYGLLTAGGLVSLLFGSMILMDSPLPELQLSLGVVLPRRARASRPSRCFWSRLAVAAQRHPPVTGAPAMIGEPGEALTAIAPERAGRSPRTARSGRRPPPSRSPRARASASTAGRRPDAHRPQRLRYSHVAVTAADLLLFIVVALSDQLDQDPRRVRARRHLPPRQAAAGSRRARA